MKKIYQRILYFVSLLVVYGLYFDIRLNNKLIKKDIRIHLLQI